MPVYGTEADALRLWESLQQAPADAQAAASPVRLKALSALDKWLAAANSERDPAVIAYYQERVDHVLTQLENEPLTEGVRVFQLYSSSVIVQTPDGILGFDLVQGPNKSLQKTAEEEGVAFRMAPQQIARLAQAVDVSFHTHEHYDHVDLEIVRALADAGKTIVVTASNRALWQDQPWHERLSVPGQTLHEPHRIGAFQVDVLWDHQWDNEEHPSGTPCNAFLVTTKAGVGVLVKGDINCGLRLYGWLNALTQRGRHVNLFLGTPFYWRGADMTPEIDALLQPLWCIGHVWEFTHRKAGARGGATGSYVMNLFTQQRNVREGAVRVLSWGEHLDFQR
jgi:hypothetical protein